MFALFACRALCEVKLKDIDGETEVEFGTATDGKDRYVIILNSGDFYYMNLVPAIVCPAILQNPLKTKLLHYYKNSNVPLKYAVVDIPKNEGFNAIINSITVPLLLNTNLNPNTKKTNIVFVSEEKITLFVESNSENKVNYLVEGLNEPQPIKESTEIPVNRGKIVTVTIDWTSVSKPFFIVKDIMIGAKLDFNTHFNCGPFYYTKETNYFDLAQDCKTPSSKDQIRSLNSYAQDVFIGDLQKIAIPEKSFVTLVLLSRTGGYVDFEAVMKNGTRITPRKLLDTSIYFHTEGTLEISSISVPYVRINYLKTDSWPTNAKVFVKPGLSQLKVTSNLNEADKADTLYQQGQFILVSANNYGLPFVFDGCDVLKKKFYNYNSQDMDNFVDPSKNYYEYPGAYAVTLPENGYCNFVYKINGFKYTNADGFDRVGTNIAESRLQVGKVEETDPSGAGNRNLTIIISIVVVVVVIIIIIVVVVCVIKKKNKGGKSSSSSK